MANKHNIIVSAVAAILLLALLAGSAISSDAPKQYVTLKTMTTTGTVDLISIADAKGYFDEQGIKIDVVGNINGGTQGVQALMSNQIDFTGSAWAPWINAVNGGSKVKVVAAGSGQNEKQPGIMYLVHKDSNINDANDLIGKKLAVNVLGAEADYVIREYLTRSGISADQVQLVVVPWPQQPQVFKSNQADLVAVNSPFSYMILEGGDARTLFSNYDMRGTTASFVYGFREDFINKNPDVVKGFVTAIAKAADWTVENPDDARKLVADIYKKNGGNVGLAKYWTPTQAWSHALIEDSDVQWWLDALSQRGTLKGAKLTPSEIYTNQFNPYYST